MVSTPPRVTGTPEDLAWRRWAEDNFAELRGETEVAITRVKAAAQSVTTGGNVAADAAIKANENQAKAALAEGTNRVASPLTDLGFWQEVIDRRRNLFDNWNFSNRLVIEAGLARNQTSQARNVTASAAGITMTPTANEGAYIDITAAVKVTKNKQLYLNSTTVAPSANLKFRITSWFAEGPSTTTAVETSNGVVAIPGAAVYYSVALVLTAGAPSVTVELAEVFEVIGTGGMNISPEGVTVNDGFGNPSMEINPSRPALAAPTKPILTTGAASVSVQWDGLLTSGAPPGYFSYIYAEEAEAAAGPWRRVGSTISRAGQDTITRPPTGSTRWYRLVAVDTSNRTSASSVSASIVVVGVDIPDMAGDIGDIVATVDGLNKIFFQPITNMPTAHANGDLWFVVDPETANVTAVYSWNGTNWVPYRLVADTVIVPGSLGTITLADGAITAPKISAREINAEHVALGSLNVDVLAPNVGAGLDISINPSVEQMNSDLEAQQLRFRFDSQGLHIGEPDTNDELRLTPGRIEMIQAGQIPSYWEAQTFYVERMIVDAANIANHRWENAGPGHTILRPL